MPTTAVEPQRTQQERSEITTTQLIAAARRLFARDGYAGTTLDAIVNECGVTKGALYHHFSGKAEIFEAVFEHEERELCNALVEASRRKRDPWSGFHAGCAAFLEAATDPGVQRILLLDAPSVLGWSRMREIEAEYGLALIKNGLRSAAQAGVLARRDIDPLAHLLFGALCEAAMFVARADDKPAAKRKFEREVKILLDALRA